MLLVMNVIFGFGEEELNDGIVLIPSFFPSFWGLQLFSHLEDKRIDSYLKLLDAFLVPWSVDSYL